MLYRQLNAVKLGTVALSNKVSYVFIFSEVYASFATNSRRAVVSYW